MIEVCGHRVLLRPKSQEKVSKGGIVIPDKILEQERLATTVGEVVSIGPTAWDDFGGDPWCQVGQWVVYAKYGGKFIKDPSTGEEFVVVNDEDIIAITKNLELEDAD